METVAETLAVKRVAARGSGRLSQAHSVRCFGQAAVLYGPLLQSKKPVGAAESVCGRKSSEAELAFRPAARSGDAGG